MSVESVKRYMKKHGYKSERSLYQDLYVNKGFSTMQVGKVLGYSRQTVYLRLKKYNLKLRSRGGLRYKIDWQKIIEIQGFKTVKEFLIVAVNQYTLLEISSYIHVSMITIYRLCKKYKIKNKKVKEKKTFYFKERNKEVKKKICTCCKKREIYPGLRCLCLECYKSGKETEEIYQVNLSKLY